MSEQTLFELVASDRQDLTQNSTHTKLQYTIIPLMVEYILVNLNVSL